MNTYLVNFHPWRAVVIARSDTRAIELAMRYRYGKAHDNNSEATRNANVEMIGLSRSGVEQVVLVGPFDDSLAARR